MAYGEGIPPEELEYTEFLFRIEELLAWIIHEGEFC